MLAKLLDEPDVVETAILGSPIGLMALHGGLENHTESIAARVAEGSGASLYTVVQGDTIAWHVPSTFYRPEESVALAGFLDHVELALSIHGHARPDHVVYLGGSNREAAEIIGEALDGAGVAATADLAEIPKGLRGLHRENPVNGPVLGGVQVELPGAARLPSVRLKVIEALTDVIVARRLGG